MLNVSKTQIMLIGTNQRLYVVDTFLVVSDDASLERVDTFKYLGVTMDETLSWNLGQEHLSPVDWHYCVTLVKVLPKSPCITLYNMMVLPLFDGCAVFWDSCGQGSKSY